MSARRFAVTVVALAMATLLVLSVGLAAGWSEVRADERPRYWPQVREARAWLKQRYSYRQWRCLHHLWQNESSWRVKARNPYSGARGIPQALPGRKMKRAERPQWGKKWDDWRTDALVQVSWGKRYVKGRYGTPCRALAFQSRYGWY